MRSEKRLIDTLIQHWRRRKGELMLPAYEQFVPESLGDEIWQHCCAFTVIKSHHRWIFTNEFAGDSIQSAIGRDITGEVMTMGKQGSQQARIFEKAEQMLTSGEPLTDEGHFINDLSQIIKFRGCLLPFGRARHYTHIVLGLSWRAF